ncbi:MAG: SGNH/GDSL hydrolase family protein [Bacteroidota bacterium]
MKKIIFLRNLFLLAGIIAGSVAWVAPRPKIFLLGDSISIHYGPHLKKFLDSVADLEQKKAETIQGKEFSRNGGDSRRVLAYLTAKTKEPDFHPDYLLLNCGLHDIGRDTLTKELQVPPDEYRKNLESIIGLVQKKKIAIIWITITPVVDSIHNTRTKLKLRYAADLDQYNQIAMDVCKHYGISTIDLHDFTSKLGTQAYLDNVHYKEDTRLLQASYIAGAVNAIINNNIPAK